jgi:two-component system response regulator AtoC
LKSIGKGETQTVSSAANEPLELVIIVGDALAVVPLPPRGALILGRDKNCDVRIDSGSVSRRHARLHLAPRLSIEDLGSANGTFVAEKATGLDVTEPLRRLHGEATDLAIGERVNLGIATIVVRRAPGAPGAAEDQPIVLDPAMKELQMKLHRAARGQINVLLLGETGVGKEVFARELHAASQRARGPFIALDCGTLPPSLAEDLLFGHEKGAHNTADRPKPGYFEAAHGGTLFLDEVGELPLEVQAKFLRVLEERVVQRLGTPVSRPVDIRIVAATNRDLRQEVARRAFRLDLLNRLDSMEIEIPPLRQRPAEIDALAQRFVLHFARMLDRPAPAVAPETLAVLRSYRWPGNVRELRNVIERAVTLCQGPLVLPDDLPPRLTLAQPPGAPADSRAPDRPPAATERDRIAQALEACGGNQTRAARMLEMPLRTLVNRLGELGLPRPRKN